MPLSEQQHRIMTELGIPVWQLRSNSRVADRESPPVASLDPDCDLTVAVWLVLPSTALDDAEARLLNAMLKTIGLNRDKVALLSDEQFKGVTESDIAGKRILLMGTTSRLSQQEECDPTVPKLIEQIAESRWIVTYGLAEMIQKPVLKAFVWQALKLLKKSY